MRIAFVDLHAQHQPLRAALDRAIGEVVASGQFILGPQVAAFEQRFAAYCGVRHAIGVGNGMDALRLALMALDVRGGDEVILPANTYVATALAVSAVGAVPVLVDCDPRTYNLDPRGLERAVTPRTRVIMPVHLTGQAADMDAVMAVAERRGLHVIEDAAQAHGAAWRGRRCGSIGAVGCFSFYPSKNLGAFGDAGMAVTNDDALARRLAQLRNYGQSQKYDHVAAGLNSRLDSLQAAVLAVKLPHLDRWNEARASRAARYRAALRGVGDLRLQEIAPGATSVYHLFVVETEHRDRLRRHLADAGIDTGVHYPVPIPLQPAYAAGYRQGQFPHTEALARRSLSLPMFPELRDDQVDAVAAAVRRFFAPSAAPTAEHTPDLAAEGAPRAGLR